FDLFWPLFDLSATSLGPSVYLFFRMNIMYSNCITNFL
ncbi:unnamed protein product, partial [Amoebophrya sp. A120]